MNFFLNFFYKLIPNYGIAIILVTILVKALALSLTRNGPSRPRECRSSSRK